MCARPVAVGDSGERLGLARPPGPMQRAAQVQSRKVNREQTVPEYKKVASPAFSFRLNKFPKFSLSILTMPGTRNLPLGDLSIESNKVPCNCSLIRVREELQ